MKEASFKGTPSKDLPNEFQAPSMPVVMEPNPESNPDETPVPQAMQIDTSNTFAQSSAICENTRGVENRVQLTPD